MTNLYQLTVSLFYQLANAFFWPVAVALLALLTITLIDLGGLFFTFWRKRRESRSDLPAIARALAESDSMEGALDDVVLSPSLRRFWTKVESRLRDRLRRQRRPVAGGSASAGRDRGSWPA